MTWSAPIDRTMSTFLVLQTAVTFAPQAFAICTAYGPTSARPAVDQDPLSLLHPAVIANGGERGQRRVADRRRLLERQVGRPGPQVLRRSAGIFGQRTAAPAEHLIARLKVLDVASDRLNVPGYVASRYLAPRPAEAETQAHHVRDTPQKVPVADVDGRCAYAYEHLVAPRDRLVDLL